MTIPTPDTAVSAASSPVHEGAASAPRTGAPTAWAAPTAHPGYWQLWRRVPGIAVYVIAIFVISMAMIGVISGIFFTGVGLSIIVIGIPLVTAALYIARAIGATDRFLLQLTGRPQIAEPLWERAPAPAAQATSTSRAWAALLRPMRGAHWWAALIHTMLVAPVLSAATFAVAISWIAGGLGGVTHWFWSRFLPDDPSDRWGGHVADALPWLFDGWDAMQVESLLFAVGGVICLVTMPWVMNGLAAAHHAVANALLGRWDSDDLAERAQTESAARAAAVHAEDSSLRRLERDIHDGPQQRLVRLQMDLAAVERRAAAGDGESAAQIAREARVHAQAALDELRALSGGMAPPLLQDRGLAAALTALATASAVPTDVDLAPDLDKIVSPEVARSVYFVVAELLTNVAKHAGAATAAVQVRWIPDASGEPASLDVQVIDAGRGGAAFTAGHGLEGLRERVRGLRGTLEVASPVGGPTRVRALIPLTR